MKQKIKKYSLKLGYIFILLLLNCLFNNIIFADILPSASNIKLSNDIQLPIENYNSDPKAEIIPLQITDTFLKVKVDGDFMDVTYLEDGEKFWIATKYSADKDLPRLPETEISRILKKR